MSHYLTREECEAKTAELNELQRDSTYNLTLTLKKDAQGWYAEVSTHTRSQNAMVAGADTLCDMMAQGGNELKVRFRTVRDENRTALMTLTRLMHSHGFGGTYLVTGLTRLPFPIWLCDVTHDVMGEHAPKVYVYGIEHN